MSNEEERFYPPLGYDEPIDVDSDDEENDEYLDNDPDSDMDDEGDVDDMDDVDDEQDDDGNDAEDEDEEEEEDMEEEMEDDDEAMTWESRSTISEVDVQADSDEWYPLPERKTPLANFALPTTTRSSFKPAEKRTTTHPESDEEGIASDEEEPEHEKHIDMMRPNPTRKQLSELTLEYFLHHGHADIIDTFCEEANLKVPEDDVEDMNERNDVKALILEGNMTAAIEKIEEISDIILQHDWWNYVIRKQHIIEMIREGKTVEPVEYFRTHLMVDGKRPCDERMEVLEQIFALMVYGDEDDSPFHKFYDQSERVETAREVNSAILYALEQQKSSRLELLAKSMVYVKSTVYNLTHNDKMTTDDTANLLFATPFGYQDMVEETLRKRPLDLTQDLC